MKPKGLVPLTLTFSLLCFLSLTAGAYECRGVRPAFQNCPAQKVSFVYWDNNEFTFQTEKGNNAPSDESGCYRLYSGVLQGPTLVAQRSVNFFPNYGGFALAKPVVVGRFSINYGQAVLLDKLSGKVISMTCTHQ